MGGGGEGEDDADYDGGCDDVDVGNAADTNGTCDTGNYDT